MFGITRSYLADYSAKNGVVPPKVFVRDFLSRSTRVLTCHCYMTGAGRQLLTSILHKSHSEGAVCSMPEIPWIVPSMSSPYVTKDEVNRNIRRYGELLVIDIERWGHLSFEEYLVNGDLWPIEESPITSFLENLFTTFYPEDRSPEYVVQEPLSSEPHVPYIEDCKGFSVRDSKVAVGVLEDYELGFGALPLPQNGMALLCGFNYDLLVAWARSCHALFHLIFHTTELSKYEGAVLAQVGAGMPELCELLFRRVSKFEIDMARRWACSIESADEILGPPGKLYEEEVNGMLAFASLHEIHHLGYGDVDVHRQALERGTLADSDSLQDSEILADRYAMWRINENGEPAMGLCMANNLFVLFHFGEKLGLKSDYHPSARLRVENALGLEAPQLMETIDIVIEKCRKESDRIGKKSNLHGEELRAIASCTTFGKLLDSSMPAD